MSSITLIFTALTLGLRHGLDWDHIAAIGDLAGAASNDAKAELVEGQGKTKAKRGFSKSPVWLASLYSLGHGAVVVLLGCLAILFSVVLPDWVDPIMEKLVGVTLVVLGLWILYSLFRATSGHHEFRLQSRWMAIIDVCVRSYDWVMHRLFGQPQKERKSSTAYGATSAFLIGALHGVGAETGTQVLLITAVAGSSKSSIGILMLLAFVIGLFLTNTVIAVLFSTSFAASKSAKVLTITLGIVTCILSLVVGSMFLFGSADILPDLGNLWQSS